MQLQLLLPLVAARLLQPAVKTNVAPTILPNAHPEQWQKCSEACPDLDRVPHQCFEREGQMYEHPECFAYSCELFACIDGAGECTDENGVKDEIWSKVSQKGFEVPSYLEECKAGTFTCLMQCPELHSFIVDDDAISRCDGAPDDQEHCRAWLERVHGCMTESGVCGGSLFDKLPAPTENVTALNMTVAKGDLQELQELTKSLDAVVRTSQEAFEATFMSACTPACERGEECLGGHCVYRPFRNRFDAGGMDGVGGIHPPPDWWNEFAGKRPNHPQKDYWNAARGHENSEARATMP